jgi:hypothetical protein
MAATFPIGNISTGQSRSRPFRGPSSTSDRVNPGGQRQVAAMAKYGSRFGGPGPLGLLVVQVGVAQAHGVSSPYSQLAIAITGRVSQFRVEALQHRPRAHDRRYSGNWLSSSRDRICALVGPWVSQVQQAGHHDAPAAKVSPAMPYVPGGHSRRCRAGVAAAATQAPASINSGTAPACG